MREAFMSREIPALALILSCALAGCTAKYTLNMSPEMPIKDETSVSPQLKEKKFTKIMVIPPSGTARGQFDREINFFEREFLKHNLTVISSAITGRVVLEVKGAEGEKKEEGAQGLSDAERALVMAKKTGADAILQIGAFGWAGRKTCRFFVANKAAPSGATGTGSKPSTAMREVSLKEFETWPEVKYSFSEQWLEFVGRLIDVQTGQVMASFNYGNTPLWNLPMAYSAVLVDEGDGYLLRESQNYAFDQGTSRKDAEDRTIERIVSAIAGKIVGQ
jgi:hypothetical protein